MATASNPKIEAKPRTIDDYLATVKPDQRATLAKLRKTIRAAVPRGEERLSYGLPPFRLDGRWIVWFGTAARHGAVYGLAAIDKDDLRGYDLSGRGTIRFRSRPPVAGGADPEAGEGPNRPDDRRSQEVRRVKHPGVDWNAELVRGDLGKAIQKFKRAMARRCSQDYRSAST